jgi:hypothetical protein
MFIYDFEVFEFDWLVVFKSLETGKYTIIHNDIIKFKSFYNHNKDKIYIGYNSRGYDQYIFKSLLCDIDPYEMNGWIIHDGMQGWEFPKNQFWKIQLYNYDIKTTHHSLKELEGFMGESIEESTVPFNIERTLTEKEIIEAIKYCKHDVDMTEKVFYERYETFESHILLLKEFKLSLKYISKTETQLTAIILDAQKKERDDEFNINLPECLLLKKYWDVGIWYFDKDNHDYDKKQEVDVEGIPHIFAWGGLHGANDNYICDGDILHIDVNSYYPSMMIEFDYQSRNIKDAEIYKTIYNQRFEYKKQKNKKEKVLKLVLNKTYGGLKDKYNNLYDPLQANHICITGQLLLLDLIEKIGENWELIQSNTDGIIGKVKNIDKIKEIVAEWENRTGLKMDFEKYKKIVQKDVNNYLVISEDGSFKGKGAYFKELNSLDNDLPVINLALKKYFIESVEVEETINNCNDLIMFQKINKISSKFSHIIYKGEELHINCIRTFASRSLTDDKIYKVNWEGKKHKIEGTPEKCFIDNSNVIGKLIPRKLDKQWYIDLAESRISDILANNLEGI